MSGLPLPAAARRPRRPSAVLVVTFLSTLVSALVLWLHVQQSPAIASFRIFGLYEATNLQVFTAPDFQITCGITAGCDAGTDDGNDVVLGENPGQVAPRKVSGDVQVTKYPFVQQFGIRAKAANCEGAPVVHAVVDGIVLPQQTITSGMSWATYTWTLPKRLGPGAHHVDIWYDNPHYSTACGSVDNRRKVYIDWYGLRPGVPHEAYAAPGAPFLSRVADPDGTDGMATLFLSNTAGPKSQTGSDTYVPVTIGGVHEVGVQVAAAYCNGWPRMQVAIDGRVVGTFTPASGYLTMYWLQVPWGNVAPGGHHVAISLLDPLYAKTGTCFFGQRFAQVDSFVLGA